MILRGDEARQPELARDAVRRLDLRSREVRRADVPHRARLYELMKRGERLLDRRPFVGHVHLVDVDHVGAQAP